jgi:hypothetical protein
MHGASVLLGFLLAVLARELLQLVLPPLLSGLAPWLFRKVSPVFLDEFVPAFMGMMVRRLGQDTIDLMLVQLFRFPGARAGLLRPETVATLREKMGGRLRAFGSPKVERMLRVGEGGSGSDGVAGWGEKAAGRSLTLSP